MPLFGLIAIGLSLSRGRVRAMRRVGGRKRSPLMIMLHLHLCRVGHHDSGIWQSWYRDKEMLGYTFGEA